MKAIKSYGWIFLVLIAVSCVPARKMEDLKKKYDTLSAELKDCKEKSRGWEATSAEMESTIAEQNKKINDLLRDSTNLGRSYRNTLEQYEEIKENHKTLKEQYNDMLKLSEKESRLLGLQLEETRYELQKKEDELNKLEEELNKLDAALKEKEASLNQLSADLEKREKRVNELEEIIAKKDAAAEALREKVANALLGFQDKGLNVEERDGKVYVSMEAKLLFASGSTKVASEGQQAIVKLAKVLETQEDLEVLVEGHTDTDAMKASSHPKDNWELSVLRATSVVKIMTSNSSIDPKILTAAGRSEYLPVGEDKAKNRRIEVILIPKLTELFDIISND